MTFDFLVRISGRKNLRAQIHRQLRTAILSGKISGGTALPSTRTMSGLLGVSRATVVKVYEMLINEGLIAGRPGSATIVAHHELRISSPSPRSRRDRLRPGPFWRSHEVFKRTTSYEVDFRVGVPDNRLLPLETWRRISNRQLRSLLRTPNYYGEAAGEAVLRGEIARHTGLSRAVHCSADDVVVTNGTQQALDLIGRVLIEPGMVVAVEEPGYLPARRLFESFGARTVGVPVDREGMIVDRLPKGTRIVYTTPSHQFPLGIHLSLPRRLELIREAGRRGIAIIEDDYDSEFRFEGRPIDSLQSLDREGTVLYVGSFSKTLFPGIRVGFVVAPKSIHGALVAAKALTDWHVAHLNQLVLAEFIASGAYAKLLRKMTKEFSMRRSLLLGKLAENLGWAKPFPSVAGLHIAAELGKGVKAAALVDFARSVNVGVYDVAPLWLGKPQFQAVMLGFGITSPEAIEEGVRRLSDFRRKK